MPLFTYECSNCGIMEDKFVKTSEPSSVLTEQCCICDPNGLEYEKVLIGTAGIHLIGKRFMNMKLKSD